MYIYTLYNYICHPTMYIYIHIYVRISQNLPSANTLYNSDLHIVYTPACMWFGDIRREQKAFQLRPKKAPKKGVPIKQLLALSSLQATASATIVARHSARQWNENPPTWHAHSLVNPQLLSFLSSPLFRILFQKTNSPMPSVCIL